jgi:hypothetical protein
MRWVVAVTAFSYPIVRWMESSIEQKYASDMFLTEKNVLDPYVQTGSVRHIPEL